MAKQIKLNVQPRAGAGRISVNKIKRQGLVPAVIYGGKEEPMNLQISAREIHNVLSHAVGEHVLVELEIGGAGDGQNRLALIQQVQHHPVRGHILHVDFHAVSADETIHAEIPIEPIGEANGVKNFGGILEIAMHSIEVECLPRDLPELIRVDVSALGIGEAIHVKDLQLPEGVTTRTDGEQNVVRVAPPAVEVEAPGAVEVAQPEVIKEKKEEAAPEKK